MVEYEEQLNMLLSIQAQRHHGGRHGYRWPCIKHYRQNNPFFRRPYIEILGIRPNRVNEIILTRGGTDPKVFDGIVWSIQIHNKKRKLLSKHASNCRMETTQIRNGVDTNNRLFLYWKPDPLPTTCNFPSAVFGSDEYTQQLPSRYIGALTSRGMTTPTILRGSTNELMFAFTFSESDMLYLISSPTAESKIISIQFDELNKYRFLLTFYSSEYEDTQGKLLRLEATTWDNVKLSLVKS
jgi:hypothetical protein